MNLSETLKVRAHHVGFFPMLAEDQAGYALQEQYGRLVSIDGRPGGRVSWDNLSHAKWLMSGHENKNNGVHSEELDRQFDQKLDPLLVKNIIK